MSNGLVYFAAQCYTAVKDLLNRTPDRPLVL